MSERTRRASIAVLASMLSAIDRIVGWRDRAPWSDVYGLGRSLLAVGNLLTLLANPARQLFLPLGTRVQDSDGVSPLAGYSLFALVPVDYLEVARWGAVFALGLIVTGWRPRVTGVVHWWLSFSMAVSIVAADGGDQVAAVLSLLLIPVTLTDSRRWHWLPRSAEVSKSEAFRSDIARSAFWVIRLQVAVVYLHAAIGKMASPNWIDGTALYYWLLHPLFGVSDALRPIAQVWLSEPLLVVVCTWGVIVFELLLGMAVLQPRRHWSRWLWLGAVFHLWIALSQGLVSFFFSMIGALVLALRPPERGFGIHAASTASLQRNARRSGEPTESGLRHRWVARPLGQRDALAEPADQ